MFSATVFTLLQTAKKSIDFLDAQLILSYILKKPREFFLSHPEYPVNFFQRLRFNTLISRRKKNTPLAYITGQKEFFGYDFYVNKHTLVPRPDTEILVENVLKNIKNSKKEITLIDIGTGSGCIPITLCKTIKNTYPQLLLQTFATDISKKTLKVAQKNAQRHDINIQFFTGNLLQPILKRTNDLKKKHILLTANLPYLTQEQFEQEPSIQQEPKRALVAPDHGLALYKELLIQIQISKLTVTAWFEIDPSQTHLLSNSIRTIFPLAPISVIQDLAGQDRVIQWTNIL